jgi:predicted transcriptional regulator
MEDRELDLIALTSNIVSAYVSHNTIVAENIPGFIGAVHSALNNASAHGADKPKEELKPAVAIKKSVTPDYIICLEDGKKFKSLKRHLRTRYDMSPEQYREKWGLPHDYPMVAPVYAATRSQLAKTMGLGQRRQPGASAQDLPSSSSKTATGARRAQGTRAGAKK